MPHGGGRRELYIFVDNFFSEAGPSYEMPILDSLLKGGFSRAEHGFVQVIY
jgi:hypothetical protein